MAAPGSAELRVLTGRATWALAGREMRRVLGLWTQTLLPPVATGLIFLAIFGGALGGRLHSVGGVSYVRFILPRRGAALDRVRAPGGEERSLALTAPAPRCDAAPEVN